MEIKTLDDIVIALATTFRITRKLAEKLTKFFDIEKESRKKYHFMSIAAKATRQTIAECRGNRDFITYIRFLAAVVKERKIFIGKQKKIRKKGKAEMLCIPAIKKPVAEKLIQMSLLGEDVKCISKERSTTGLGSYRDQP